MPVFKTFFRVIKATRNSLLVYLFVFLGIATMTSKYYKSPVRTDFEESKISIAVINRDGNSDIAKGLADYLAKTNTIVDLPDNAEKLQDALFFRKVEYIAIIPKGFAENFKTDNGGKIETVVVPNSTSSIYLDMIIDRYMQTLRLTSDYSGLSPQAQAELVADSLSVKADVRMNASTAESSSNGFVNYFNYFTYVMLALSTLGISTILMVFNQPDLKRRNLCAPVSQRNVNLQLALGSALYSLFCWAIITVFGILIYGKPLVTSGLLPILMLNSFVFSVVSTTIGFLVGILIKSHNVQAAIANVLSLGMSFLCGVFVPQAYLGSGVLRFASFLPAYWFVKANNTIGQFGLKKGQNEILIAILIQLGFAVAIFSITLFISKQKRTEN